MKSLLTSLVLILSLSANSQITSFIKHGDTVYCYFPSTRDSIRVNYSAAAGSASWGGIQGTIGSQTDLQNLINSYLTIASAAATYQPIGSYLTGNQTVTLSGDISGTGATAITTTIGAAKVTNAMLAGSIAASKLVGSDIVLPESQITNLTTDLALKQDVSTNKGGWTEKRVSGSDFTTTNTSLTTVTGLVSGTLSTSTLYEFEAVLYVNSSSTAGIIIGVNQTGTGTGSVGVFSGTATNAAATGISIGSNALNTATAACVLVAADGTVSIRGFIKTSSSGSPTILIQVGKVTSGTAKVYIGSAFRYRIAQ